MSEKLAKTSRPQLKAEALASASYVIGGPRLLVGTAPAFLYATHLLFGANSLLAAQSLTFGLSILLVAALFLPRPRRDLSRVKFLFPHLLALTLVLAIAGLTLSAPPLSAAKAIWSASGFAGSASLNRYATILEMIKLGGLACVAILGCLQGARTRRARATIEILVLLGGVYAVASLVMFLSGLQVRQGGRLTGGFMSANSAATVFGILIVIATGVLLRSWYRFRPARLSQRALAMAPYGVCLALFCTCLLLTASRMGVAATLLSLLTFATWEAMATRARLASLIAGGLLAVSAAAVLFLVSGGVLLERLDEVGTDAANRGQIFAAHWAAFERSPLFGYGLGTFADVNNHIMTPDNYAALWSIRAAHNVYIQWLEEAGLVGAIPMFLLIGSLIVFTCLGVRQMRSCQVLARGLVASSAVVLIHGTTDYALQVPSIAAFWAFVLGLQYALASRRHQRSRRPSSHRNSRSVPHQKPNALMTGVA